MYSGHKVALLFWLFGEFLFPRKHVGKSEENKGQANPLAFLLTAPVSVQLLLPRTPQWPRPQRTETLPAAARLLVPKAAPLETVSAAEPQWDSLFLRTPHIPTKGQKRQVGTLRYLGWWPRFTLQSENYSPITDHLHCFRFVAEILTHLGDKHLEKAWNRFLFVCPGCDSIPTGASVDVNLLCQSCRIEKWEDSTENESPESNTSSLGSHVFCF